MARHRRRTTGDTSPCRRRAASSWSFYGRTGPSWRRRRRRRRTGGVPRALARAASRGGDAAAWLIPDDGGGGCGSGRDLYSQLWHGIADADAHGGAGAGSSFCGSNAVTAPALLPSPEEEPGSSSAGGHAVLFKRGRNEIECRGEDADECEAVDETRPSKRPTAKRRTRAADVHNLSERRRRDRINEKMKALQELVPHCNKSDKASILDDTIEYLKSLQLQLQIMWMTTGMAPMMFPGAHRLMPPMAMGLNPGCMPPAQSLSQLQRVAPFMNNPLPNQMSQVRSPVTSSPNVTNQMQINGICEPRNPFLDPNDTLAAAAAAQVVGTHFIYLDLSVVCYWWLMVSVLLLGARNVPLWISTCGTQRSS
uniref:Uncharacterized protein n=3 Tax=Avena sativa TaxID=4498 RepID=A0ACD5U9S2_AVESA